MVQVGGGDGRGEGILVVLGEKLGGQQPQYPCKQCQFGTIGTLECINEMLERVL
jgi:hypothetical protein